MATAINSIYYVYGNRTYVDEIKELIQKRFSTYSQLNIGNPNGCGFKVESYDIGDLKSLEVEIEQYEGWIQTERRNEFTDINADFLDFDRFIAGCNNRISTDKINDLNFILNSHKGVVVLRTMSFLGGVDTGKYKIIMGKDSINGSVPPGAAITDNRLIKKTLGLIPDIETAFYMFTTDCSLTGVIAEYSGINDVKNWTRANPFPSGTDIGKIGDETLETLEEYPYDNYPRMVINRSNEIKVLKMCIVFDISGTSGDTYKFFEGAIQGGFNANTGINTFFKNCYNATTGQHFNFTDNPMDPIPENMEMFLELDLDAPVTQLRISLDSVEHPYPLKPSPEPLFRIKEVLIKTL